jgi:hypothetical protein
MQTKQADGEKFMLKILVNLCIGMIFCFSNVKASHIEELTEAFEGKQPFYAVTVTRTTPKDVENRFYTPLLYEDIYFVFSALKSFTAQMPSKEEFKENIRKILQKEHSKFGQIEDYIEKRLSEEKNENNYNLYMKQEIFSILDKVKKYSKEEIEIIQTLIMEKHGLNEGSIKLLKPGVSKIQTVENQIQKLENLLKSDLSQPFESYIRSKINQEISPIDDYFFQEMKSKKQSVEAYLDSRYQTAIKQYDTFFPYLKKYNSLPLQKEWLLIVFNEMFFSQTVPLSKEYTDRVLEFIEDLTKSNLRTMSNINFLKEQEKRFDDASDYNSYIQKEKEKSQKLFDLEKSFFEHSSLGYAEYMGRFDNPHPPYRLLQLYNKSDLYWNGLPLLSYKKTSYHHEADSLLANNYFYRFGTGEDISLSDKIHFLKIKVQNLCQDIETTAEKYQLVKERIDEESDIHTRIKNLLESRQNLFQKVENIEQTYRPLIKLSQLMKNCIATETCYDLELGMRRRINLYPQNHKLHIFTSNTLPLKIKNLPLNVPIVFHVDPDPNNQGRVFSNTALKVNLSEDYNQEDVDNAFYNEEYLKQNSPCFPTLLIKMNGYSLAFKFWDLQKSYLQSSEGQFKI